MSLRTYLIVSGAIFAIVAMAHLLRIVSQSPIIVGMWSFPISGSWIGFIAAAFLSLGAFKLLAR